MMLRTLPAYDFIEVKAENVIGLRKRADGTTVVLQRISPAHLHVADRFDDVCLAIHMEGSVSA